MQKTLFELSAKEQISLQDGGLILYPNWLSSRKADAYFTQLRKQCAWQQSTLRIAGKDVKIPRLNAWYGEKGADYQYSGVSFQALPWIRSLRALRARLHRQLDQDKIQFQSAQLLGTAFQSNSALVNCYRDGQDSVAWHADDEPELGQQPLIASVSLGETRRFLLKRRDGTQRQTLELDHGSLLLMLPPTQTFWLHCLPKTKTKIRERINVTFRHVLPRSCD